MLQWINRFLKEPFNEQELEQVDFLLRGLSTFLIVVILTASIVGFIVTTIL